MIIQGVSFIVANLTLAKIGGIIPRPICLGVCLVTDVCMYISWLFWQPKTDQYWVVVIYAVLHGMIQASYKVGFGGICIRIIVYG